MNTLTLLQETEEDAARTDEGEHADPLGRLRREVDDLDRRLVALLAERGRLAAAIGRVKTDRGMGTTDPAREAQVVRRAAEQARSNGLDPDAVRDVYWRVIALSHQVQRDGD